MTTRPEHEEPETRPKPTALWYVGMPVMIFGIVSATMFSMRQHKERDQGHTYYEFILPAVALACIGFVLLFLGRRRTSPR